ncbi:hypothetical protein GCM10020331_097710 [Ectobacillus funiculus]
MDTSALTGESVPRKVETGSEVLSGFINKNGILTVEVTKEFGESTVSKKFWTSYKMQAVAKRRQRTSLQSSHDTIHHLSSLLLQH